MAERKIGFGGCGPWGYDIVNTSAHYPHMTVALIVSLNLCTIIEIAFVSGGRKHGVWDRRTSLCFVRMEQGARLGVSSGVFIGPLIGFLMSRVY